MSETPFNDVFRTFTRVPNDVKWNVSSRKYIQLIQIIDWNTIIIHQIMHI